MDAPAESNSLWLRRVFFSAKRASQLGLPTLLKLVHRMLLFHADMTKFESSWELLFTVCIATTGFIMSTQAGQRNNFETNASAVQKAVENAVKMVFECANFAGQPSIIVYRLLRVVNCGSNDMNCFFF